jgi:hypothetical protein
MKITVGSTLESLGYWTDGWLGHLYSMKYVNAAGDSYSVYKGGVWIHKSDATGTGSNELIRHYTTAVHNQSQKAPEPVDVTTLYGPQYKVHEVFPDFCSTGVWDQKSGVNVDVPDYMPNVVQMALKYWHFTWETYIATYHPDETSKCSRAFFNEWQEDGEAITDVMNHYACIESTGDVFEYKPERFR